MLGEDRNTRSSITQAASLTAGADPLGPALDYLISCAYSSSSNELMLLAGNNQGAVGCFPVAEPLAPGGTCSFGSPKALLSGAHESVSGTTYQKFVSCTHAQTDLQLCHMHELEERLIHVSLLVHVHLHRTRLFGCCSHCYIMCNHAPGSGVS